MFRNAISQTALTTLFAEEYFRGKITGLTYQGDCTFVSTLRALVAPRMSEEDHVTFYAQNIPPDRGDAEEMAARAMRNWEINGGEIIVNNVQYGDTERLNKYMQAIEKYFESTHNGWKRILKVTDFYRKVFKVLCFVNVEHKAVMIFAENMDLRKYHYLQCGIFAFLPWYFNPADGVSSQEMDLINSLREKTSEKYEQCIDKLAERYDFRTAGIKSMLDGFELKFERIRYEEVKRDIEYLIQRINDLSAQIGNMLADKRTKDALLLGLETKLSSGSGNSEIMDYFLRNKRLTLVNVNDTTMEFFVKEYLTFFDEDMAKNAIDNPTSYIYKPGGRNRSGIIPADDMKKLMTAVFLDQTIKIKFCAAYRFRLEGNVRALAQFNYGSECRDYMPNTHIDRFSCLGNYERSINEFLRDRDYIGAIEQCVASCKSLNFGDGFVMNEFMNRVYGCSEYTSNNKCFELPDGSVVTPKEAIEYLHGLDGEESGNG